MSLERPPDVALMPSQTPLTKIWRDLDGQNIGNGIAAMVTATTGPLAVFLAAAAQGHLGPIEIAAFIFAGYTVGGILSIALSLVWRQTLGMCWTIPGVVLMGAALTHLSFAEVIGAYLMTGVLLLVLGVTGWVGRLSAALPMPIVMAMVAGVFLSFGLNLVHAFGQSWPIAVAMVAGYLLVTFARAAIPPVLGALVAGTIVMLAMGQFTAVDTGNAHWIASPTVFMPVFSWPAALELVVPLAITVVGIHNAQGIAVLKSNGFKPAVNTLTVICGLGTLVQGLFGAVPLCVTGPANAILNTSGVWGRRYMGGVVFGVLILLFGLFAPVMTIIALGLPAAFVGALGGLAMLRVLEQSFVAAFSGKVTLGALVTFLITVANISPFNIGAPFWGLVFGYATAWLLERRQLMPGN